MEERLVVSAVIDNSLSAKDFQKYFLRRLSVSALLRNVWIMSITVLGMAILTGIFSGAFRHLEQIQTALHDPFFMGTAVLSGVFYGLVCAALDQIIEGRYGLKQWQETHDY